ncbi:hypothetical protein IEO21_11218 [Rhodonia placenta]|uniref:Uncharacterized protein n=1 Tax=Rhodonia placenta TaxID=104341 RepID=A0A8H7NR75_9APHY|nr:hypothetical protein IEO21_11218 [Postia placenta]
MERNRLDRSLGARHYAPRCSSTVRCSRTYIFPAVR